jgi:signal recognition particle receptor subunit beta
VVSINYGRKEISCKIVYYGPGLGGKTTNLQIIHQRIPKKSRSDMVSLSTESDRTLFFDFLPLDLGTIKGFSTKFQLYTVPGQVYYNQTRKLVLRGVDGIVFVADSQKEMLQETKDSYTNLEDNLSVYNLTLDQIPLVIQYNKRDLDNILPVEILNEQVNKLNVPYFEAIAIKGRGVFESLKAISKVVMDHYNTEPILRKGTSKYQKKSDLQTQSGIDVRAPESAKKETVKDIPPPKPEPPPEPEKTVKPDIESEVEKYIRMTKRSDTPEVQPAASSLADKTVPPPEPKGTIKPGMDLEDMQIKSKPDISENRPETPPAKKTEPRRILKSFKWFKRNEPEEKKEPPPIKKPETESDPFLSERKKPKTAPPSDKSGPTEKKADDQNSSDYLNIEPYSGADANETDKKRKTRPAPDEGNTPNPDFDPFSEDNRN